MKYVLIKMARKMFNKYQKVNRNIAVFEIWRAQIDSMYPCVCSVIDHKWPWRQNVVKTMKWHTSRWRACHWYFSVIYYWISLDYIITAPPPNLTRLLRNTASYAGYMESICFIQWSGKKKKTDTHTCLLRLDCSRICASLGIFLTFFKSQALLFVTASSFFLYLNCTVIVNSFFEKFFNVFPCSKHNNGEYILENGESLIAMKHDGSCCEHFL